MAGGGVAVAAAAVVVMVPVLAVSGLIRGVHNSTVNDQIESRQTLLPVALQKGEERNIVSFFPLSPSPRHIEVDYIDSQGDHTLIIETQAALEGLHIVQAEK